mmetsp:Transcript_101981/g.263595  ORF Transcript_101981/g.263595 Transcript_101981/m.263595 type:complete len:391 (-) Transcript_101981:252-1424(-)
MTLDITSLWGLTAPPVHFCLLAALIFLIGYKAGSWRTPVNGKRTSRQSPPSSPTHSKHRVPTSPSQAEQLREFDDPLRWSFVPSKGAHRANTRKPFQGETDLASLKILVLHRPTHDREREASGQYPYSEHFMGRRRTWEVRVQVRFKKVPQGAIYFGLETRYIAGHTMSPGVRRIKNMLLGMVRGVIGKEFHHSPGDDPETTEGEAEPPTFAMPLWAIDQFHVAEDGEEPDLTADFTGIGHKRTGGVNRYIEAMRTMLDSLSCDKVYTFCFWGISQFVDGHNWEFRSKFFTMDANKLCGAPPVYVVAYELEAHPDLRHLVSRKSYYFKVALWSALKPPEPEIMKELLGNALEHTNGDGQEQIRPTCWTRKGGGWDFMNMFSSCTGRSCRQ